MSERIVSRRALKALQRPHDFVKYVLVRADVAGFSVTPARVDSIARAVAAIPPDQLVSQGIDPLEYYKGIFASVLAQDPESARLFDRFWEDLWYVKPLTASSRPDVDSNVDRLVDGIVDDLLRKMSGAPIRVPREVIEE